MLPRIVIAALLLAPLGALGAAAQPSSTGAQEATPLRNATRADTAPRTATARRVRRTEWVDNDEYRRRRSRAATAAAARGR